MLCLSGSSTKMLRAAISLLTSQLIEDVIEKMVVTPYVEQSMAC